MNSLAVFTQEFRGLPVHFDSEAEVNMTDMGAIFGKKPIQFLRQLETKKYIALLEEILAEEEARDANSKGVPAAPLKPVFFVQKGRHGGGTWAHPDLAMEFARWLDKRFSIWCNRIIRKIFSGELVIGPAPLPVKLPPFLSEWHHQRFLAKKAAVEELLTASQQWGRFLKTAEEIQARHPGERGFSSRSLIRDFYRWEKNGFDDLSLLIGFTKKAA